MNEELAKMVIEIDNIARSQGLFIGGGRDRNLPNTEEYQEGPKWKAIKNKAKEILENKQNQEIYKIFHKKTGKYYSGGNKTNDVYVRKGSARSAITGRYGRSKKEDYELHVFDCTLKGKENL